MGSSNVACSVSNISIDAGDPVVYIPLVKNPYGDDLCTGNRYPFLIYCNCFYNPATLPIFGEYNDYGGLEKIETTKVVTIAEDFFGTGIESIFSREMPPPLVSGMFVHREVYDHLINNLYEEDGSQGDGEYSDWIFKGKEEQLKILEEVKASMKEMFEARGALEKLKSTDDVDKDNAMEVIKNCKATLVILSGEFQTEGLGRLGFRDMKVLAEIYADAVMNGEIDDEILAFARFKTAMFCCNTFFFPAMNGCQCGNDFMSRELYKISAKVVADKLKVRESW